MDRNEMYFALLMTMAKTPKYKVVILAGSQNEGKFILDSMMKVFAKHYVVFPNGTDVKSRNWNRVIFKNESIAQMVTNPRRMIGSEFNCVLVSDGIYYSPDHEWFDYALVSCRPNTNVKYLNEYV